MGICHTKKSIQSIIHSKYSLAKDSLTKIKTAQFYHVYIWKYNDDELSQKDIMFYEAQNKFFNEEQLKSSNKNQKQDNAIQQSLNQDSQFLIGEALQWPFKVHADQGYIVLTIKSNSRQFEKILANSTQKLMNDAKIKKENVRIKNLFLDQFRHRKTSLELLQILYMIHLDSFKSYYFTQIKQQKQYSQYEATIEIITGDLLDKINCLKLVSISYQLQKYLKMGEQNVLKKFYNQYQSIFIAENQEYTQSTNAINKSQKPKQANTKNKIISEEIDKKSLQNNKSLNSGGTQLQIQRVLLNQIRKIKFSENYQAENQKQKEIYKLFKNLYLTLSKFHILKNTLLDNLILQQAQDINETQTKRLKSYKSKAYLNAQSTKMILEKIQQNVSVEKQTQKLLIIQQIFYKNVGKQIQFANGNLKPHELKDFQSLDMENGDISIIQKPNKSNNKKSQTKNQDLDTSSPFMCQITQINGLQDSAQKFEENNNLKRSQKNLKMFSKNKQQQILQKNGQIQDSLFLPKQLQQLKIDRNLYKILLDQNTSGQLKNTNNLQNQTPLILTTYTGSSQYQQLLKQNINLIINLSPQDCYNYFIHDLNYEWYYIQPIHKILNEDQLLSKNIQDINSQKIYLYNIQCLIYEILERINSALELQKQENSSYQNNKVCIFCGHKNMIYSGTIAVAYLMFSNSFRLSFDRAYQLVKLSTKNKFLIPKIYETQLKSLLERIQQTSSTTNLNSLNTKSSSYRAFEVGLYSLEDLSLIVPRYIGQISSSNQLQLLDNNSLKSYFLVPNNLTSIIIKTINILREDTSILNSNNTSQKLSNISKLIKNMGFSLRVFCGKQLAPDQKEFYYSFAKQILLSPLIQFQYVNFKKSIFNIQKYKAKLDLIIDSIKQLITTQTVQKSFRKPQPFDQSMISNVRNIQILKRVPLSHQNHRRQPFNSKQILTFKYPILRPIFQSKKKDSYYFMIRKSIDQTEKKGNGMGCNVTFYKGQGWIGLQQDKQRYFQKIVQQYLKDVNQQKIWIQDNQQSGVQRSLFDGDSLMF